MGLYDVNATLVEALSNSPLIYPIVWEGKTTTPNYKQPFIEKAVLPSGLDELQTVDKASGIIEITIHHPLNTGSPILFRDADTLVNYFIPTTLFEYNGHKVRVRKRYTTNIGRTKDTIYISVIVSWRSVFNRDN